MGNNPKTAHPKGGGIPVLVKRRNKGVSRALRYRVFRRDKFTCQYCGRKPPEVILHCDHVLPASRGGDESMDNLVTACRPCNLAKHNSLDSPADKAIQLALLARDSDRIYRPKKSQPVPAPKKPKKPDMPDWWYVAWGQTFERIDLVKDLAKFCRFKVPINPLDVSIDEFSWESRRRFYLERGSKLSRFQIRELKVNIWFYEI